MGYDPSVHSATINSDSVTLTATNEHVGTHADIEYLHELREELQYLDTPIFEAMAHWVKAVKREDHTVFVLGNGGSNANAGHLALHLRQAGVRVVDLLSDVSYLTALSNDEDYSNVPRARLSLEARCKDLLIALSGSGESENVLLALAAANRMEMGTIGLLGFGGGTAKRLCDISLVLPTKSYGVIEDCHSVALHILSRLVADKG